MKIKKLEVIAIIQEKIALRKKSKKKKMHFSYSTL